MTGTAQAIAVDNIPAALAERTAWVLWKIIERNGEKKKVPFGVDGRPAKANDPSTWSTFDRVVKVFNPSRFAGIGYEFSADDPFVGVDLDGCRNPETGEIAQWGGEIIRALDTFCEISPSRTGVKLFLVGKSPLPKGKKKLLIDMPRAADKTPAVEVYDHGRYFAVTGNRLDGPAEPQPRQAQLDSLVARFWPPTSTSPSERNGHRTTTPILERARKYIAKMPPAISGQDGSGRTMAVACALCVGFNLGRDDALALMHEYNRRCEPPWSEKELEHKVDDALEADGERGHLLVNERNGKPPGRKRFDMSAADVPANGQTTNLLSSAGRTDAANARRLAQLHGADLHWCDPWSKWPIWDRRRWSLDSERRVDAMAKDVAAAVWKQVASVLPDVDRSIERELLAFARTTSSAKGIAAMQTLAKSEPGIPILPEKLDADGWALNVENGTLDLRTGELREHRREDLLTKLCPVSFDPAATCPTWDATLTTILGGNTDLITFLQRAVGYSLTGSVEEHSLFLLWGSGANGKSTFLNAIIDTLGGDYAMQAPDGLLMVKHGESHPTERADLHGKRFVSSVEVEEGRRLAESLVKSLTGGDAIRARRMREDYWEFRPSHKLWMAANHKPVIRGTDRGIWRRIKLVPFVVTIADGDQDKKLAEKLKAERAGILAWAVRGCLEWQQHGLSEPDQVKGATATYRDEMDVVGGFVAECCIVGPAFTAKASDVYGRYAQWCRERGEYAVNQRRFGLAMSERGVARYTSDGIWYRGLGLVTERTEPTEGGF